LDDGAVYSRLKTIDAGTGVLNSIEHVNDHTLPNKGDCLSTPDVEKGRSESIELSPGFEDFGAGADEIVKKNPRRKQLFTERTMTRSQKKLDKSSSQITTESMRKLPEESLEIGKILGVKVIAKEVNAKRRIIDSLKEEKRKEKQLRIGAKMMPPTHCRFRGHATLALGGLGLLCAHSGEGWSWFK